MPDLLSLLLLLHAFFLALWARLFLRIAAILEKNWYILAQTLDFLPAELYNRGTQPLAMARKAMYGGGDRMFCDWWDWTQLILLPAIALSRIAQARISAAHNHYSRMDAGPRINGPSHLLKRHPKSGGGIIRLMAP